MKVKLRPPKRRRDRHDPHVIEWTTANPFFINPRGILSHRVRSACTIQYDGKDHHHCVQYWCGNQTCFDLDQMDALVNDPPKDRLLCTVCESRATAAEEKPADKLAGRHVHLGVLKAHRVCCNNDNN